MNTNKNRIEESKVNVSIGDKISYKHPVSKKTLTDTAVNVQGDKITVDRPQHQNTSNLVISTRDLEK